MDWNEIPEPWCEGGAVIFRSDPETTVIVPRKDIAYLKGNARLTVVLKNGQEVDSAHYTRTWLNCCPQLFDDE